jgi:alanyl-tRNA synthetase
MARRDFEVLMDSVQTISGVPVVAAQVSVADVDAMREITDWYRARVHSGVIVLGAAIDGRPQIVAAVTEDLTGRGLHAGKLAGAVAKVVGGGGGGPMIETISPAWAQKSVGCSACTCTLPVL